MKHLIICTLIFVACNPVQNVKDSIDEANAIIDSTNNKTTINIDSISKRGLYDLAVKVNTTADELVRYLEDIKLGVIVNADTANAKNAIVNGKIVIANVTNKYDYISPTVYMIGDAKRKGAAYTIHDKMDAYRKFLLSFISDNEKSTYEDSLSKRVFTFDPEDPEIDNWEKYIFFHTPLVAAVAHISKLQGDIRKDEGVLINYFYSKAK